MLPTRSPNINAHAERFIQTLRDECLDRFIVPGAGHLDRIVAEYADYYNRQRPNSSLPNRTPAACGPPEATAPSDAARLGWQVRLGGFVLHYFRRVA